VTLGELAQLLGAARILSGEPDDVVTAVSVASSLAETSPGAVAVIESEPPVPPARPALLADAGVDAEAAAMAGLVDAEPLVRLRLDWRKLVAFVPADAVAGVRRALFAAGAGRIGEYEHCSFELAGTGTFRGLSGARPAVGEAGVEERVAEVRLETVYPRWREDDVVAALVRAHPYEEPAFDLLALANVAASRGRGRVGRMAGEPAAAWIGDDAALERRARALGARRVHVSADDARRAAAAAGARVAALTGLPLAAAGEGARAGRPAAAAGELVLSVDGGARGNPGPAAIGYRLETAAGEVLEERGETIGVATNNVAEYRALLAGLEAAARAGARVLQVRADSELLVRQMSGAYRVRSDVLRPLWERAQAAVRGFARVDFRAVPRGRNADADRLVNEALDSDPA
jgi:ribonuclease HI